MIHEITILAIYRDAARAKLTKLAKRAARYGQSIEWTEAPRTKVFSPTKSEDVIDLRITGEAPKCGDFQFKASLERTDSGIIIAGIPGHEVGAVGREWDGRCDHCHRGHNRKFGFVVENGDEVKVVGRTCLRDHTGIDSPAGVVSQFQTLIEISELDEDSFSGGKRALETVDLIAKTRAAIKLWGWRPASAQQDGITTAHYVWLTYHPLTAGKLARSDHANKELLLAELRDNADRYRAEAQAIVDWARDLDAKNDYLHNLKVACAGSHVFDNHVNLVISASAAFDRQQAIIEKRATEADLRAELAKTSKHVGTVGDRLTMPVSLIQTRYMGEGQFGPRLMHQFKTEDGSVLVWWSSVTLPRVDGEQPSQGDKFDLSFTVKGHSDYQGTKQTTITRAKAVFVD